MKLLICIYIFTFSFVQTWAQGEQIDLIQNPLIPNRLSSVAQICQIEIKNCHQLSKPAHLETLFLIKQNQAWINYLGKKYHVKPQLIASIFLAEQSLIFTTSDVLQNLLARLNFKINSSLGPLQLSAGALKTSEQLLAQLDRRPALDLNQIRKKILKLKDALYYATGYLLHIQNVYKKYNLNIENHLGLMGTIYTLGSPEWRAKRTLQLNKPMQISYYGYFIEVNKDLITQALHKTFSKSLQRVSHYHAGGDIKSNINK